MEGSYADLPDDQRAAFDLLKHVNTVAAKVPGSQASKFYIHNEIRSYFGYFGLPHIFLTINPNAIHSPIFQLIFGDTTVDLSERYPFLKTAAERAKCVAKDPVAAADFFEFCVTCLYEHLFGWDYKRSCSTSRGGILGRLRAFYGTSELTQRGGLHGHFVNWLEGGLNPNELHEHLRSDSDFESHFFFIL